MGEDELAELFGMLEAFSVRRLFGGQGIYDGAMIVAIVLRGTLYLKGDDQTAPLFEAEGCDRWLSAKRTRADGHAVLVGARSDLRRSG